MAAKFNARRGKVGSRKTLDSVLVYCQGTETEVQYFERLKEHHHLTYDIRSEAKDPLQMVHNATRLSSRGDSYDEIYVVVDVDETPLHALEQAARLCRDKRTRRLKIHLVVSNPSFEIWLLRSTGDTKTHQRSPSEMAQTLGNRGLLEGKGLKHIPAAFPFDKAADSVAEIKSSAYDEVGRNPATSVGLLINRLLQLENPNQTRRADQRQK